MGSARVRFLVEASVLITLGVALAVAGVDLFVFTAIVAAALIVLAALERAVLQSAFPARKGSPRAGDGGLPLHEGGAAELAEATATQAAAPAPPVWRPPVVEEPVEEDAEEPEEEPEEKPAPTFTGWPIARESPRGGWREPEPEFDAEPVRTIGERQPGPAAVEPEAAAVEPEPAPTEPEPVATVEPEPVATVEPTPVGVAEPTPAALEVVDVAPTPEPPAEPAPEPEPRHVVELPARAGREWNLWDLERRARERSGEDPFQDEEWAALFVYLREYATPDGMLPPEFDELVRESFAGLLMVR